MGWTSWNKYRTHMSLWSLSALRRLREMICGIFQKNNLDILIKKEVIAIDQDPLGKQAKQVSKEVILRFWLARLPRGRLCRWAL